MRKALFSGWALLAALLLTAAGCQGVNDRFAGPRPRSTPAAGEFEELPPERQVSSRRSIDGSGGEVSMRGVKLTIPVGAVTSPIFVELSQPASPPIEVMPGTAVQISPQGIELRSDALLSIHYNQSDIPPDRTEREIVLVQQVSGVWVEVPNAKQQEHIDLIEAPIRFLGLYALQLRPFDQRQFNSPPVARFEVSPNPFQGMYEVAEEPVEEQEQEQAAAVPPPPEGGTLLPSGEYLPPEATGQTDTTRGTSAADGVNGSGANAAEGAANGNGRSGRQTRLVQERRWVAQVADAELPAAGPDAPAGNAAEAAASGDAPAAETPPQTITQTISVANDDSTFFFDASASHDPDGMIVQYSWDFDSDGIFDFTSHRGPYARHTFRYSGDYTVTLKVIDNGRYPRAAYATNLVSVRDPQAAPAPLTAAIAAFPPVGPVALTVNFASTVTGGSPPYKYNWRFTDGSQSDLPNPFTTYPEVSQHTITFTVSDTRGAQLTGSLYVDACECETADTAGRMTLQATPGAQSGRAPHAARFNLAPDRFTEPISYRVTFGDEGDGQNETVTRDRTLTHTYTNPGFYVMKVLATDALLRTSTSFATVHVTAADEPRDFMLGRPEAGGDIHSVRHDLHIGIAYDAASPRTVRFSPRETPLPAEQMSYQWDFGDGTYSTDRESRKTFARDGVYEVRLTASDGLQLYRHQIWLPVAADDAAAAIQTPTYVEGPAPLRMKWDAIVSRGEAPLRYQWTFGDESRTDHSPIHEFREPGEYEVRLTVFDRHNQPITAPVVVVRARQHSRDYRQPLAVVSPDEGGNRAVVLDYDASQPLALSSSRVEGNVSAVDISPDGETVALVSAEGVLVKRVSDGERIASFLPAAGSVVRTVAIEGGGAYASVSSAEGLRTYLVMPGRRPLLVGQGVVLDAARFGEFVVLKRAAEANVAADAAVVRVNPDAGTVGEPRTFGKVLEARLTDDGKELFFISSEMRVMRRELSAPRSVAVTGASGRKSSLAVAGDGSAIAYVSETDGERGVYYGRRMSGGDFELTSLTGATGFFSDSLELSSDGRFLLAHGSRNEVRRLIEAEGQSVEARELNMPHVTGEPSAPRADRVGILRLDLGVPPDGWRMSTINPRFVVESQPQFSNAGPF